MDSDAARAEALTSAQGGDQSAVTLPAATVVHVAASLSSPNHEHISSLKSTVVARQKATSEKGSEPKLAELQFFELGSRASKTRSKRKDFKSEGEDSSEDEKIEESESEESEIEGGDGEYDGDDSDEVQTSSKSTLAAKGSSTSKSSTTPGVKAKVLSENAEPSEELDCTYRLTGLNFSSNIVPRQDRLLDTEAKKLSGSHRGALRKKKPTNSRGKPGQALYEEVSPTPHHSCLGWKVSGTASVFVATADSEVHIFLNSPSNLQLLQSLEECESEVILHNFRASSGSLPHVCQVLKGFVFIAHHLCLIRLVSGKMARYQFDFVDHSIRVLSPSCYPLTLESLLMPTETQMELRVLQGLFKTLLLTDEVKA